MRKDKQEYNDYMSQYMLRRYHERRKEAILILGGKCVKCESVENLEIDHIDPSTKTMSISKAWSVSKEKFLNELKLCQLLCNGHHMEKTSLESSVEHGGGLTGKRNCYCDLCGPLKREYNSQYKRPSNN